MADENAPFDNPDFRLAKPMPHTFLGGQSPAHKKIQPQFAGFEKDVGLQVSGVTGRLKLVEQRIDTVRDRIELIDNSLIEKHKSVVAEVNDIKDSLGSLKGEVDGVKDIIERIAGRLDAFASKQEVKVLSRYVDLWQPMQFVTKKEVEDLMRRFNNERGAK